MSYKKVVRKVISIVSNRVEPYHFNQDKYNYVHLGQLKWILQVSKKIKIVECILVITRKRNYPFSKSYI